MFGFRHQPGGQVHRIAHHGVHTTIIGADRPCEHMTGVDTDRERQLDSGIEQAASGAQHAAFAVLGSIWCAGREDQLAAVAGDVGRDQADAGLGGSPGACFDQGLQSSMQFVGALIVEHRVGVAEVHEPDRDATMFGFDRSALGPTPNCGSNEVGEVHVAAVDSGRSLGVAGW